MKLVDSGARPKSNAGRKAKPLDEGFLGALAKALTENPTVEHNGEIRPRLLGADTEHETKGKATSEGRRYQEVLAKQDIKVRVSAQPSGNKWKWTVFIPMSANGNSAENTEEETE